ncbi:SDR family oxidoreductase [Profundibacter amoris]|uniref:NAD-dependent epimerase/dehydratase family protein n=1 Tax=Profundibacter amoris TaxID=2171755 RepID=A0A347UJA5_9RHOB|nr:SDR family oxidoreductase [Profundibacter amoris]AXX98933.1 NAD-dependent epimerase/dehydratase family protein [Profundibacter amoris]
MPAPQTLLLGAAGFIGQHIAIALRDAGHNVLACARDTRRLTAMGFDTLAADLTDPATHSPEFWRPHVENCTRVINCAGLLTGRDADFEAVHVAAPQAVYAALPATARGVLISAIGINADTPFATYRRRGEKAAQAAPIPVTILRPGLVLADGSYGGSSLARALAALPMVTPVVGNGNQPFNPIHADDLAALAIEAINADTPAQPIEIGGPGEITQAALLTSLRAWLGLRPARILHLPLPLARLMGRIGDSLRLAPISATSVQQLEQGVATDITEQSRHFQTRPRGFAAFLRARPSQTQDLWHARLYLLRPVLRLTLALMWLASGLIGLLLPVDSFLPYVSGLLPDTMLIVAARITGAIDLLIALALLRAWRLKQIAWLQFAMVAGYTVGLTLINPALWLAPFGGLLKNLPILVLIMIHRVLEEER